MKSVQRRSSIQRSLQRIAAAGLLSGFSALLGSPASWAAVTTYTDKAAFEAALNPGYYEEPDMYTQFTTNNPAGSYSGQGFTYTVSVTPDNVSPLVFSTQASNQDITPGGGPPSSLLFSFGPGIRAFGGYIYANDINGDFVASGVDFDLNNGAYTATLSPSSYETSFYGFISDDELTSAKLSIGSDNFPATGTVIVGSVPTPAPLPIVGAMLGFQFSRRLRLRQRGSSSYATN